MNRVTIPVPVLMSALAATEGNIERAAKSIGVGRLTLMRRMREHGLSQAVATMRDGDVAPVKRTRLERNRERYWRCKQDGKCFRCAKPSPRVRCPECAEKHRKANRKCS